MNILCSPWEPDLISNIYKDRDELVTVMNRYRRIEVDPLSLHPFNLYFNQVDYGDLLILIADIQTPIQFVGDRHRGYIQFDLLLRPPERKAFSHGLVCDYQSLSSFDFNRGADNIFPQNTLLSDLHIQWDLFKETCLTMGREDLLKSTFPQKECFYVGDTLNACRGYLWEIYHLFLMESNLLKSYHYYQLIKGDLLPLLINSIPIQTPRVPKSTQFSKQAHLVSRARDYIHANLHRPLTLKEIYEALDVSRRTLYYSFEAIFQLSPLEYLKIQRLQGVNAALKQADPQYDTVRAIAQQWGFWSTGHFARSYQQMFGEFPTETLRHSVSL